MKELKVRKKFRKLISPLNKYQLAALKEEILWRGKAYSPIIIWNGVILDGHYRYEICKQYKLPFKVRDMKFENEKAAMDWIIKEHPSRLKGKKYVSMIDIETKLERVAIRYGYHLFFYHADCCIYNEFSEDGYEVRDRRCIITNVAVPCAWPPKQGEYLLNARKEWNDGK